MFKYSSLRISRFYSFKVPIKIGTELVEVFDSNLSVAPPAYEEISVK